MQALLDRGQVDGVVRVLPGFARDIDARPHHQRAGAAGRHQFQHRLASFPATPRRRSRAIRSEAVSEAQRDQLVGGTMSSGGAVALADAAGRLANARLVQSRSAAAAIISSRA